jgi:hypothetical protein
MRHVLLAQALYEQIKKIADQPAFAHLDIFDELVRFNAGRIFRAMKFE